MMSKGKGCRQAFLQIVLKLKSLMTGPLVLLQSDKLYFFAFDKPFLHNPCLCKKLPK